jgi:sugar (pentulose or hexulose) kinase
MSEPGRTPRRIAIGNTNMLVYAIDLGTTNLKVALYGEDVRPLALKSARVDYARKGDMVEFDPDQWFDQIIVLMNACYIESGRNTDNEDIVIALTGQAESIVLVDRDHKVLRPGISWLDTRSGAECIEIADRFDPLESFRVTGQPLVTSTWPATKLRWLKHHEPKILDAAAYVLMLKDFIQMRFTGEILGELSTRAFSYFFDINAADYWDSMMEFCGVHRAQMPTLVNPGTDIGPVRASIKSRLPKAAHYSVNVGALDHFSSMIGTGSYQPGLASESAGTVLSLSVVLDEYRGDHAPIASYHRGVRGSDYVLFDICDSGGVCLDWYMKVTASQFAAQSLDDRLASYDFKSAPIFLPYLIGVNPPDNNSAARGAFVDLTLAHDQVDMLYSVVEGIAHLLRRNVEYCQTIIPNLNSLVSTGGGAESKYWTQLKADTSNCQILVPPDKEAACRGAAIIGLAGRGMIEDYGNRDESLRLPMREYVPARSDIREERYGRFLEAVDRLYGAPLAS